MAARLKVRDATPCAPAQSTRRDGVGIDRDTETAAERIKFDFEVLERGCDFDFRLELENATSDDMALLYILLKEMERGIDVGGKKMRGLGRVTLTDYQVEYFDSARDYRLDRYLSEGYAVASKTNFESHLKSYVSALITPGPSGGSNAASRQ
jgi:CRISPR/Cas system CSM-associated protein Csm3 (group 7 of RAMP superfamily)